MNIKKLLPILFLASTLFAHSAAPKTDSKSSKKEIKTFRGIYADESTDGIYNPERGLRLEVAIDLATEGDVWDPKNFTQVDHKLISESKAYQSDSITLVQSYFYLHKYSEKDLDETAFKNMNTYFNALRTLGKKAVLRFAYETGWGSDGPKKEIIYRHTKQLKPIIEANLDVIAVMQAGIIGAWGEWHSSRHGHENNPETMKAIIEHIMDMTPKNRFVQIRVPKYKNLISKDSPLYNRIAFHDDMIIIKPHVWDGDMHEGTEAFAQIVKESPYVPVDGEMPWGEWSISDKTEGPEAGWIIDGTTTARQLFLEHFTSFSVTHNYKEFKSGKTGKYSMMHWKETPISIDYLKSQNMPISSCYFQNSDNSKVERNVFDYIRDHLGYRLELQKLTLDSKLNRNTEAIIDLSLINRGFSTLFNEHPIYFVMIDNSGKVYEFQTDADVNTFQPYNPNDNTKTPLVHNIKGKLNLKTLPKGEYKLGLWIPDGDQRLKHNNRYSIRCANGDVQWWSSPDQKYGVNILTTIKL